MGFSWDDFYNPLTLSEDTLRNYGKVINWGQRQFSDPNQGSNPDGSPSGASPAPPAAPSGGGWGTSPDQKMTNLQQQTGLATPVNTDDELRKNLLSQQAALSGQFAGQAQENYNQLGSQGRGALWGLQQTAQGQNSVSAEQLRQAMLRGQAQQQSMAASAAPQNAAAAARTAAIQSGRQNAGLAGQQAVAGLQERNQAQSQYGQLLQGLRQQDYGAALGSRQNAISGYGAGNAGAPTPGAVQTYGPAVAAGAAYIASDRRLKTDVQGGDDEANKMLEALKAYSYRYKDEDKLGAGKRTGVMAQDLERGGMRHAVIDTPGGKMVHGGHLSTANTAMIAALHKRLKRIEGKAA